MMVDFQLLIVWYTHYDGFRLDVLFKFASIKVVSDLHPQALNWKLKNRRGAGGV